MNINRSIFYALAFFAALLQSLFGTAAGFSDPDSDVFGKFAGILGIITWMWIIILMLFNRKPQSTNPLCRSYTHLTSFIGFGVAWLAIFIMLACQIRRECNSTSWCAVARFSTALAFFTSFFSIVAAYLIYRSAAASGLGLGANIDQVQKDLNESEP